VKSATFRKLRQCESLEFSSLTVATRIYKDDSIRIALSGIDPGPVLVEAKTSDSKKEIIARVTKKAKTIDNDMYLRKYRRDMIAVFLNEML